MREGIALLPVIVLLLGIMLIPNYLFSQEDCNELPEEIEETCTDWDFIPVTRSFPITSGCTITFNYWERECTETYCGYERTIKQYRFSSIDIPENCYAVLNQLFPGWPDDFGTINNNYFNNLIDGIFLQLGRDDFSYRDDPPCAGSPPYCSMPERCNSKF